MLKRLITFISDGRGRGDCHTRWQTKRRSSGVWGKLHCYLCTYFLCTLVYL